MYAIIQTGGKQYRVAKGDVIHVELLGIETGETVEFPEVLFVNDGKSSHVGNPHVKGYVVQGKLQRRVPGPKVVSMKYKPRKRQERKFGHRQKYDSVEITKIGAPAKAKKTKVEEPSPA